MAYSLEEILDLKREVELSAFCDLSGIHSSYCMRARLRGQKIAEFVVDEKGKIDRRRLEKLAELDYILYPNGTSDADLTLHIRRVVRALLEDEKLFLSIQRAGFPVCNATAHEYVSDSIGMAATQDAHLKRALLSALFTPLRQNVGSCFATAPAILVQEEQIARLAEDLLQILHTGQLRRVFGGDEYVVPMSPTAGSGDLKKLVDRERVVFSPALQAVMGERRLVLGDSIEQILAATFDGEELRRSRARVVAFIDHPLLKMWEFTLASFSEVKMDFSRWNLYISLGLHHEEAGGIGSVIYRYLDERLQEENAQLHKYQEETIISWEQVRATERLLAQAGSEAEGRRLKVEHQSRLYQLHACAEKRDLHQENAQQLAGFFAFLIKEYDAEFPRHFQEIYDADMDSTSSVDVDDSPAGFRLAYKHGRVGNWSFIHTPKEYVQALSDFFLMTEAEIAEKTQWKRAKLELSKLTGLISHHLHTEEFLQSAFKRMVRARGASKPWAYVSGGTMPTLLNVYFRRENPLVEEVKRVENATELCTFLIDFLKTHSHEGRILMSSPTHAFSMLPDEPLLKRASEERIFTYTWVRDELILPMQRFYAGMLLSPAEQNFLSKKAKLSVSPMPFPLTPKEWRAQFPPSKELDGFLFASLPLIPAEEWREKAKLLLEEIGGDIELLAPVSDYVTRWEAHFSLIQACPLLQRRDLHIELAKAMRRLKLAPPEPLIVADTNWAKYFFAFLVSPATGEFELWRTDKIGLSGLPMVEWKYTSEGVWSIYVL